MNFYLDITLIPGADIGHYFLWGKVYKQIHLGLVAIQNYHGLSPIGISFPEYSNELCSLGSKLRIFAEDKVVLENFNAKKWLNFLSDYTHITSIREVPQNICSYVRFKRKQSKSNLERLARRKAKYEAISFDQALELLKNRKEQLINAPYINISSNSSGESFKIFIIKEVAHELINNGFSCYGLSATSTLPNF
ncbi:MULTISPECIES: type I-F CRISPR-associated endoribonuclease Cas6/Csy4 [Legionella]|uniref:CRISPR-associated endonuclease Cas6/Csy4 n=1 Tax=Legionella maceachernii TaxID=466 RepID=A0A0W0WE55_9GAMM|nr:type I-F CRISPR-associated endoribonuclease Cas6/Csy4 [Legionella maceachernii]KTD30594.1 CRISPR-associated endonuclease Cas6/Csy4 [Legionella maceachernii]SJZ97783.1 CRISPR-associated endonuclease Csy4 [Legionella maceachernii]SUP01099.1 CRISPR-associated protein Cas6/Csy4, subtype I-F/YPEST [Legionella maceachernii]